MNTQIVSKRAAVHTRDIARGTDYGWHVKKGDLWLYQRIEEIYRSVLRDTSGDTRKFALLIAEKRAGLLLCDMASERIDHGNRIIYDTLFTEFDGTEKSGLLEHGACLLTCPDEEYKAVEKQAVAYAEQLYRNREQTETKEIPCTFSLCKSRVEPARFSGKIALSYKGDTNFPDDANVRKCAAYLRWLAKEPRRFFENGNSFVFVSTGRAGKEKCRQLADLYDTCLILTMTSEIDRELRLQENPVLRILKKNIISEILPVK
ncbi:MAG: hypothetical protein V2I97_02835 [Desulfococcaceae bacterium]|jgi:hypothetical protein|nr:hypothetical protein [Desulfococcaceae bacterium]